jgi:heat shock protein HslJ
MKKNILLIALIVMFSSCNGTKQITEVATYDIPSGKYEIRSIQEAPVYKMYFEIDASENKISGKTNCNTYGGNYTITNNNISFGTLFATEMYCEEHVMKEERSLFEALGNAKTFVFDNNMFTLSSETGVVLRAYKQIKKQ